MKIPLSWLREFVELKVEPERLGEALTLVGLAIEGIDKAGGDAVLDVDVTTNRVDCMNVYGVAREVAAIYGLPLRPLDVQVQEKGSPASQALQVTIEAPELCPRFCGRVLDVRLGPSPAWVRDRLAQVGVRPINNLVDLTNYVMMEMGHPSHAFDLAKVAEGRLNVRWARPGEKLETLDGVERVLDGRMGVVAGVESALALAGVMGGATSEVSDETTAIALEAAYWDPPSIRRTAKALGMHTEASHRFERGADPEAAAVATSRIAHLLEKIGAGSARPGIIETLGQPKARRELELRFARVEQLLGAPVPSDRVTEILAALGFATLADAASTSGKGAGSASSSGKGSGPEARTLKVQVPSWRGDVAREVDLVEEVARHHGLDRLPSTLPPARIPGGLTTGQTRVRRLREVLVGAGLAEAVNFGLVDRARTQAFGEASVALRNPLSSDLDALRSSLLPGLVANLETNLRQGRRDVALFEVGRVFAPPTAAEALPVEEERLAFLVTGALRPRHWSERSPAADFFTAKGLLEALALRLDEPELLVGEVAGLPAFLHPGRSASVRARNVAVGFAGALHPDLQRDLDVRDEVVVAELRLTGWLDRPSASARARPLDRFPSVARDLSLVVDAGLRASELVERIRRAGGEMLRAVEIRDRYLGEPIPEGKVSLTVALRFQDVARTLTGDEVQAAVDEVAHELRAAGAEIRE